MKTSKEVLSELHKELALILSKQIRLTDEEGKANGSILNVARQFLKDNGIDGDIREVKELQILSEALPFDDDEVVVPFKRMTS
jgi:hypothetical protein